MSDWKELATNEAIKRGVPVPLVLATIEAETGGRNVLGDSGRAFGYGQVWLKWHYNTLVKVAQEFRVTIPEKPTTVQAEEKFKPLLLNNDALSMALAVETIKGFWLSSGGDWDKFTHAYVGPAIPDKDLERRRAILKKYTSGGSVGSVSPTSQVGGVNVSTLAMVGAGALLLLAILN
jgi:hypothetical protein